MGFVATFTGTDLGSSYSTGALDFKPKAVLVYAATATRVGFGYGVSTSTTAGVGQARVEVNGTSTAEDVTEALQLNSTEWDITAFSSAGITLERVTGSEVTTMYIVVVLG